MYMSMPLTGFDLFIILYCFMHGRFTSQHPMTNDDLPNRINCGSLSICPNVRNITADSVEFENGMTENDIDVIVYATGYKVGFPFIDPSVIKVGSTS